MMQTEFSGFEHPFYGPVELAGDLWASDRREIFKNVGWCFQLNVRNAWAMAATFPSPPTPPAASPLVLILNEPRWFLSSRFSF